MEFIRCPSVSGANLAKSIIEALKRLGLDVNVLQGQSYDGAGNMAGPKSGVSSRILNDHPKALYFHCSSHRLHLVVASNCKLPSVRNMMDTVKKCSDIFHFSPKKQDLLQEHIKEQSPSEIRTKLLDVCRTRWFLRCSSRYYWHWKISKTILMGVTIEMRVLTQMVYTRQYCHSPF